MKNLTIIVFIILVSCPLFAQDPFNPINFDGIEPQWSHFFVDSSRVISELSEGTEVLAEREILTLGDSVAYFIFRDRADRNSGVLIEKMDLNSGNILWSSKFDERETGFHEFPAYFGMTENGTLELVGYKIAQDFSPIFGWSLGHFLRRVIDPETGEELALFFNDQFEEEEKMFIFGNARILKEEDNFIFVNQEYIPDEDNGQILYEFKHFSNSSSLLSLDSVMLTLSNIGYLSSPIFPLSDGFAGLRHTGQDLFELEDLRDLDPEEFEIVLDIFDTDLQHTLGIDITEVLPAMWHSFIWNTYDDLILIKNLDSAYLRDYGILPHVYFSVFDQGGNHLSDIYLGQELGPNLLTPARIPNTNDFVFFKIVNPLSTEKGIEVWLLEEGGNSSLLTTLEFADEREIRLASNIEILENGDVLFFYTAQTRTSGGASENYHNTVMRLSAEDIGLPTSTQYRPEETLAIHVYPNPFRQVLHADFGEPIKGDFSVFDLQGKLVAEVPLQGQSELSWDASALPAGAYVMTIRSGDKLWTSKVIKVE